MPKSYDEINEKIRRGDVVVVTAEEMVEVVAELGPADAAAKIDVVTTGTLGPMCSSGAVLNIGHSTPRMKISAAWLNDVRAYCGLAAVDMYIGATEVAEGDPLNRNHPGRFNYGGGHVIEDLVAGRDVHLRAEAYGTDCYPRRELDTWINIRDLNEAYMLNPRNAYQNYNVAVNKFADRDIYTYMGVVKRDLGSANYCSAGQLSPLLNDPCYRTIGIGSRIFLGGAQGYVYWQGTQHDPSAPRNERGVPTCGAGTLATVGDLKQMDPRYVVGVSIYGYGTSLAVGVGTAIPVLDEEIAFHTGVSDADITAPIIDYSRNYGLNEGEPLGWVSYAQLKSGSIEIEGRRVPTTPLSSYVRAREIAEKLKSWIAAGSFLLTKPVQPLPSADSGVTFRPLTYRPVGEEGGE
ncbi:MAG: homocysteine biosynthesis protein [Armatimonadota bacterium]